ncbi:hypothetical protein BDF21DRAFT_405395 [Thamnidium elegans]|nr:hypothetical protein BDF21DRAFT_405395 [Thamnidium elegans]
MMWVHLVKNKNRVLLQRTGKRKAKRDFLFDRRIKPKQDDIISIPNHGLELRDFTFEEVENVYRPRYIEPGRKPVVNATVGLDYSQRQVRRCSTKEYYHLTGLTP